MKKIGFIGLGNMGSKMVLNLLNAKYEVFGYDINDESVDKLVPFGMKKVDTLLDISQEIEIVITMLPNGDEVRKVFEHIKKNLNPNTLFVDCSTVKVNDAQEIHQKCLDNNLLCLDAPVSLLHRPLDSAEPASKSSVSKTVTERNTENNHSQLLKKVLAGYIFTLFGL